MFIVYIFNTQFKSWDYLTTFKDPSDIGYLLFDLLVQYDHDQDQYLLLYCLIRNKVYYGKNVKIYFFDEDIDHGVRNT